MQIKPRLMLECHLCLWRPDPAVQMLEVIKHFTDNHPALERPQLDLAAVCSCGQTMKLTASRPTGGGFKDWFLCLGCGNEGWIKRGGGEANYKAVEEQRT